MDDQTPLPAFAVFSTSHVVVVAATTAAAVGLCHAARRRHSAPGAKQPWDLALALVLALAYPLKLYVMGTSSVFPDWEGRLPAHLCDVVALLAAVCLVLPPGRRKQRVAEIVYFWGLAGTLQGLLTPGLKIGFPHPEFFRFFLLHGGVVVAAVYVVWGLGLRPEAGAVRRGMIWLHVYLAAAALTSLATSSNYGFVCAPPPSPSLADVLGGWPWYIAGFAGLAFVFFSLLYFIGKPRNFLKLSKD